MVGVELKEVPEYEVKTFSRFGVWYPIVVFSVSIFAIAALSVVLTLLGVDLLNNQDLLLTTNGLLFAMLGAGAWLGWKLKKSKLSEVFSIKNISKKQLALTLVIYALLQPVLLVLSYILTTYAGLEITGNSGDIIQNELSIVKMLAIILIAPVFEEIFFRGVLFDGFLNSFRKFIPVRDSIRVASSIAFTGVFFGLMHLTAFNVNGIVSVITTAALGMSFAILRVKTGSLSLSILAHFTFNSVGFAFIALSYFIAS
jgi:membrane protease YdiL (CAAX protease family)